MTAATEKKKGSTTEARSLVIVPYDSAWPVQYAAESRRILALTNPWLLESEHIGSTAVPGLAAKPVIDMMYACSSLRDVETLCVTPLETAGYTYVESYNATMPQRRFFVRHNAEGERSHHMHVVVKNSDFWLKHSLFRDYLRAHPEKAATYASLKRDLAPQFKSGDAYAKAKSSFILGCLEAAGRWRDARRG